MKSIRHLTLALAAAAAVCAAPASAQVTFPQKPVTIVVPYSAGGSTDLLARVVAAALSEEWKQPVLVVNRVGASGNIGIGSVAKSDLDGYSMVMITAPSDLAFDILNPDSAAVDSLAPVALVAKTPVVLTIRSSLEAKDFESFIKLARAKPGELKFGAQGPGSLAHLSFEQIMSKTNSKLLMVPYKGAADISTAISGGFLEAYIGSYTSGRALVDSGHGRIVAVVGNSRIPAIPDIPTMADLGYQGVIWDSWFGLLAPGKTPAAVVEKIHNDVNRVLSSERVQADIAKLNLVKEQSDRTQFQSLVAAEKTKLIETMKSAGLLK